DGPCPGLAPVDGDREPRGALRLLTLDRDREGEGGVRRNIDAEAEAGWRRREQRGPPALTLERVARAHDRGPEGIAVALRDGTRRIVFGRELANDLLDGDRRRQSRLVGPQPVPEHEHHDGERRGEQEA